MNSLRFTVRFRADQEEECRAAEYLKSLKHGDQNRFLVEAVLSALKSGTAASPDCRQIIREELDERGIQVPPEEPSLVTARSWNTVAV